jgi:hypothetical protein
MKLRVLLTSLALALAGPMGPGVVLAGPAHGATVSHSAVAKQQQHQKHHHKKKHHKKKHKQAAHSGGCTQTSSGSCIRGGEFCPQSKYNQSGYDANGTRYVCKGDHTHPHWEVP